MGNIKHKTNITQTKKEAFQRIAEFIDYVKVQHEMKSANSNKKEKLLNFNRKEVKIKW